MGGDYDSGVERDASYKNAQRNHSAQNTYIVFGKPLHRLVALSLEQVAVVLKFRGIDFCGVAVHLEGKLHRDT